MDTQQNEQLANALMLVANQLSGKPKEKVNRKRRKTVLPLSMLLDDSLDKSRLMDKYTRDAATKSRGTKHTIAATGNAVAPPLNETSFFLDCTLDRTVINATYGTGESLLSMLSARGTNFRDVKHSFITSIDSSVTDPSQVNPCDPAQQVNDAIGACAIDLPLSRQQLSNKTGEIDIIIQQACQGIYDDFIFIGDIRGVNAVPDMRFTPDDRGLITDGAILKSMKMVGRNNAQWMTSKLWTGDPSNNTVGGGYKEALGLLLLVTDNYPADLAGFLNGTDCDQLDSDVKDFLSACIGGGVSSIWEFMLEADHTIMLRENLLGLVRQENLIVMNPIMLRAFSEAVPCEMVGQGCNGGVINANDGGSGVFNLAEQNRIRNERVIILNGTEYRIVLDSGIPAPRISEGVYESSIFGLTRIVSGEEVLFVEYNNYSGFERALEPVNDLVSESWGWTDGGKYFHTIERKQTCFEVTTKSEWRVINKAPHLDWRIDNVRACYLQDKPEADLTGINPVPQPI